MPWKLTVRAGPRVKKHHFEALAEALDALESRAREASEAAPNRTVDAKIKQFEPARQVVARLELAGPERFAPGVRAGVDVRGDGSTEAYVGRLRRTVIEQRRGESAYKALRRAVGDQARAAQPASAATAAKGK
jgi:hypothetical protein